MSAMARQGPETSNWVFAFASNSTEIRGARRLAPRTNPIRSVSRSGRTIQVTNF
jgi:hypothetical protein